MNRHQQRQVVMTCIYQYLLLDKDFDEILKDNLDIDDKESISFIVNETADVVNNLEPLTEQISAHLKDWTFDRLGYVEQAILLIAASELNKGEIDRPIVINEAVELAKTFCDDDAPALINGVLDQL